MNQHTSDNRPDTEESAGIDGLGADSDEMPVDAADIPAPDPLDEVDVELDRLSEIDPAESVAVLADITAALNREIDADQETS